MITELRDRYDERSVIVGMAVMVIMFGISDIIAGNINDGLLLIDVGIVCVLIADEE